MGKNYIVTFCGSFRRGADSSADIDILLTHNNYVSSGHAKENKDSRNKKDLIIDSEKSAMELLERVVNKLIDIKFITDTIALGETKYMVYYSNHIKTLLLKLITKIKKKGVCSFNKKSPFRRIDIRLIPHDQYYCGVFYFTGSDMFNRNIRKLAHEKGFILNEYSLRKLSESGIPGKALPIKSEQDIFDHLGLDYKLPKDRIE